MCSRPPVTPVLALDREGHGSLPPCPLSRDSSPAAVRSSCSDLQQGRDAAGRPGRRTKPALPALPAQVGGTAPGLYPRQGLGALLTPDPSSSSSSSRAAPAPERAEPSSQAQQAQGTPAPGNTEEVITGARLVGTPGTPTAPDVLGLSSPLRGYGWSLLVADSCESVTA